jgi:hypothetical protein
MPSGKPCCGYQTAVIWLPVVGTYYLKQFIMNALVSAVSLAAQA